MPSYFILYQLPGSLCPFPGLILAELETIPSILGIALLLAHYRHTLEIVRAQFQTTAKKCVSQ